MVTVFSDPMVDALCDLGAIIHVPPFYLSFIITPICSNASESLSSLIFAAKKQRKRYAVTYGQLYGAATMNNTLCLGIFVALVYIKNLPWNYSAEVLSIFVVNVIVGLIGLKQTLPTCMSKLFFLLHVGIGFVVLALYPFALGLVIFMENVLHWH